MQLGNLYNNLCWKEPCELIHSKYFGSWPFKPWHDSGTGIIFQGCDVGVFFLHTLRTLEALTINMYYNTVRETYTNFKCAPSLLFNSSIHCSALRWTHYHHCQSHNTWSDLPLPQNLSTLKTDLGTVWSSSGVLQRSYGTGSHMCCPLYVMPKTIAWFSSSWWYFSIHSHKRDTWEHTSWRYNVAQRLNFYGVSTLNAKKSTCSRQGHHTRM